jgi:Ribosomal RNA adenine dimethylase
LYNHIAPKNHILLDHKRRHFPGLDPIVKAAPEGVVKYLDRNPWLFKSYSDFLDGGIVKFELKEPDEENPSLLFVANLVDDRSWKTESVTAHLLQFMHKHCFIYAFGRIRTWLWIQAPHWYPLLAPIGHKNRKKITIMRELCCDAHVIAFSGNSTRNRDIEEVPVFDKSGVVPILGDMFYPNVYGHQIFTNLSGPDRTD